VSAAQSGQPFAPPIAAGRLWDLFWTLDRRRQSNGYGVNAVSHQEIAACAAVYGVRLARWELRALDAMERERLLWLNTPEKERRSVAAEQMTVARFRTMFRTSEGKAT